MVFINFWGMTSFSVHSTFMLLLGILVTLATVLFGASFSALLRVATMLDGCLFVSYFLLFLLFSGEI